MTITREVLEDKITIDEHGNVMVREATRFIENGEVIGQSFHRRAISPGDDINAQPEGMAKDIAEKIHTPAKVASYRAKLAADQAAFDAQRQPPV